LRELQAWPTPRQSSVSIEPAADLTEAKEEMKSSKFIDPVAAAVILNVTPNRILALLAQTDPGSGFLVRSLDDPRHIRRNKPAPLERSWRQPNRRNRFERFAVWAIGCA
jgi:hypothetical protein